MDSQYSIVLFSNDGAYVTDFQSNNKQESLRLWGDSGSRWFFYPIGLLMKDGKIVDDYDTDSDYDNPINSFIKNGLDKLGGKTPKEVSSFITDNKHNIASLLLTEL